MNRIFAQKSRLGRLTTVLDSDALVLVRFHGTDQLNGLFEYRVEALATDAEIDFDELLGTHAGVGLLHTTSVDLQWFDGIVTQISWAGLGENGHRYDLTLRPWIWIAGRRRNQRIFHNRSVVRILEELFGTYSGLGSPHLEVRLRRDYPVLEYTVQYRESDLDFARRMMERFGINYHFTHDEGNHTMVLTDTVEDHDPVPCELRPYHGTDGRHQRDGEGFWEWRPERNLTTGAVRLTDYNFKKPTGTMEVHRIGEATHALGQIESFDYPGDYLDEGQGKEVARLRTAQERGGDVRHRAVGDCLSLRSGMTMTLEGDPVPGATGQQFLCLTATHSYGSEAYGTGSSASSEPAYSGQYTLIPVSSPLAPPRLSAMPIVRGPQTAIVVGEGEIDCDEFGRILVRFHWDLGGEKSMRCRVAQSWAGTGWGGMVIPRVGMEVVVEFLEGDLDQPLVTGCLYNAKNMPANGLPAAKTKSGFKTQTHGGGGFNELTFEDEAGREEVFVHAQKDLRRVILDNESTTVREGDRTVTVETGDERKTILSGNLIETVAKTRGVTANTVVATAKTGGPNSSQQAVLDPGAIVYDADNKISLTVGSGTILMTPEAIVVRFGSSQIVLTEGIIDQVAAMIHLNKDSAG